MLLKIFYFLLIVFVTLLLFYIKNINSNTIKSFSNHITKQDSEDFQKFLYENVGKFVKIEVKLSKEMANELNKGMDSDGKIVFTAKDMVNPSKKVNYTILLPDSGERYFDFNNSSLVLKGYFKTDKKVSPKESNPIVDLIPVPKNIVLK